MKAKHRRLLWLMASLGLMALAATAILYAFRDNMVFFYTPTQLAEKRQLAGFDPSRALRIGGLVEKGSIVNLPEGGMRFTITDLNATIAVTYRGMVPSLFRENQGVVAQGLLAADGSLRAETILAKHDENYMPRSVVEALKASGKWQEGGAYRNGKTP
jgi:cytochrome c-type biogenesis protein CcmE